MNKEIKRLDSVHQKLLAKISPLSDEIFARQPSVGEWSVSQIVHHLRLVEERVIKDLEVAVAGPPQRPGFLKKFLPTSIVSIRTIKVKSPKGVTPLDSPAKEVAIANYDRARDALKELCDRSGRERMRNVVFNHPFLGKMDGIATISFLGYHEHRHYKQILDVLKKLGKETRN